MRILTGGEELKVFSSTERMRGVDVRNVHNSFLYLSRFKNKKMKNSQSKTFNSTTQKRQQQQRHFRYSQNDDVINNAGKKCLSNSNIVCIGDGGSGGDLTHQYSSLLFQVSGCVRAFIVPVRPVIFFIHSVFSFFLNGRNRITTQVHSLCQQCGQTVSVLFQRGAVTTSP